MKNCWLELDTGVLGSNLKSVQKRLSSGSEIIFVIKSNAYGHGMHQTALCAWEHGVRIFAVAHADEALRLRSELPQAKVIIVGSVLPSDAAKIAGDRLIVPVITDFQQAQVLSEAADAAGGKMECHIKIDTGMGRLGIPWFELKEHLTDLLKLHGIDLTGICTHLSASDTPDRKYSDLQIDRFSQAVADCAEQGLDFDFKHISNSGGVISNRNWDMQGVRPGILIYGYGHEHDNNSAPTYPWLQWKTKILQVKDVPEGFCVSYGSTHVTDSRTKLATIDAGYADGYHRSLSNCGVVLVGGRRCPVVGRVTMNLTVVDVGIDSDAVTGDEVVLIGRQGDAEIWADELATRAGTIPYEILTSIRTDCRVYS